MPRLPSSAARAAIRAAAAAALVALAPAPVAAQAYVNDARAAVPVPAMLGRGDAGVAVARRETSFFVNPAHVAAGDGRLHVTLAGVGAGLTSSAPGVVQRLSGEADGGCTDGSGGSAGSPCGGLTDAEVVAATLRPAEAHGTLLLPSFSVRSGSVGVSAGLFAHSRLRVQSRQGTARDSVYTFMQSDGIAAATLSARLPRSVTDRTGVITLGAGLRYVRRYASLYDLDAGALAALDDPAVTEGSAVAVDVGALWETPVQGLDLGLAVYDLGGAMAYGESEFFGLLGSGGSDLQAARVARALDGRDGQPSFRAGAAYRPDVPAGVPALVLAADYVSASTTGYVQPVLGHLRVGAEAALARRLAVRAGLSGGGPSAGFTLDLVALKLDYAVFMQPSGRFDGQDGGARHALLLRFGLD